MQKIQPIPNSACLVTACNELGIRYRFHDEHHNLVGVILDQEYFFANGSTPFNDEAVGKICQDKEFTYKIVSGTVRMPTTVGFIDPDCNPVYRDYALFSRHDDIASKIEKRFSYPVIIKMNSGSRGINVFRCTSQLSVKNALASIYSKSSQYYDYVALAQEYIQIIKEYRVIVFQSKIILVYEKDFSLATCTDNISPFHQKNSKARLVNDQVLTERICTFITPLFEKFPIGFAGLDIAINAIDDMYLIEINSKPGFEYFVRDNGMVPLVNMYKEMLVYLKEK